MANTGGWYASCAICGLTFDSELPIDSDEETDATYSGEIVEKSDWKCSTLLLSMLVVWEKESR